MLKSCSSRGKKKSSLVGSQKEKEPCVLSCSNLEWSLYLSEVGETRKGERSSGFGLNAIDFCLFFFFYQILIYFLKQMFPPLPVPLGPFLKALNSFCFCFPLFCIIFLVFIVFTSFRQRAGQHSSSLYHAQSQSHHYVLEQAKQRGSGLGMKAIKQSGTQDYYL